MYTNPDPIITEPGVYRVLAHDYHADGLLPEPSLSSSGARRITGACPAVYWYERNNPPRPTEALVEGSAAHEWVLEGDTWPARHVVLPEDFDGRTKEGKALRRDAEERGKRVITAEQFATIKAMKEALEAHPFAGAAFRDGEAEQSLFWQDEEFGIWCRARPDFLPRNGRIVADYKTCLSAHPEALSRAIERYGYHQQAAWYIDGIQALGLIQDPVFLFAFQEKTPPYEIVCAPLDDESLIMGRTLNRLARARFAECLRSGRWPGYADDVLLLGVPGYAKAAFQRNHEAGLYEPEHPTQELEAA